MSTGYMSVAALAERLGIDRSNVHRRVRRAGARTISLPVATDGGVQSCTFVPMEFADELLATFAAARANALGTAEPGAGQAA